eukprot:TRINITY_DN19860_c0_g1_i1.p1 TRINITY_DN19860_c0_g1~~TRINITY_DN19860_c0_g1_i1.p1  ORF type:complete len:211 (-),score=10.78 TRINITY_DN19860_c0_g1_i1:78-710(-)
MASHRLFWASLLMTIVLSSALTPSATKPTRPFARSSADDLSKRPLRELLTTDDTGAPLAPETLALLDRIDHVIATGEVKDVMDVALHFGKIFGPGNTAGAAAAGGVGSTAQVAAANGTSTTAEAKPTVEQMLRDFKRFSDALNRPIHLPKYGIIARIIKKIADNAGECWTSRRVDRKEKGKSNSYAPESMTPSRKDCVSNEIDKVQQSGL